MNTKKEEREEKKPAARAKRPPKKIIIRLPDKNKEALDTASAIIRQTRDKIKRAGRVKKVSALEYMEEKMQSEIKAAKSRIAKSMATETNRGRLIIGAILIGGEQTVIEIIKTIETATNGVFRLSPGAVSGRISLMRKTNLGLIILKNTGLGRSSAYRIPDIAVPLGVDKLYDLTLSDHSLEDAYRELPILKQIICDLPLPTKAIEEKNKSASLTGTEAITFQGLITDVLDSWLDGLTAERLQRIIKRSGIKPIIKKMIKEIIDKNKISP